MKSLLLSLLFITGCTIVPARADSTFKQCPDDPERQMLRSLELQTLVKEDQDGYIQHYQANKVGGGWWPEAIEGTFGIDQFIGDPTMVGKGFGTRIIKQFVENLFLRVDFFEVITDPEPKNRRAIRAYEKVGFSIIGEIKTPGGEALLMKMKRSLETKTR